MGTRRSPLARVQTQLVVTRLARAYPTVSFEAVGTETSGDRDPRPGGSTDFTDAIDRALLAGEVDLAVHSAKDLPVRLDAGLRIVACLPRGDPRDALVLRPGIASGALPRGARVGTSSPRRRAQLLRWRPDLHVTEMRGNVDTRLQAVRSGRFDGAVLALAGLRRLRHGSEVAVRLSTVAFLPAPGQGVVAVVARAGKRRPARLGAAIDEPTVGACLAAERAFSAALGGDCTHPLAALATARGGGLRLEGEVLRPNGSASLRAHAYVGTLAGAVPLGRRVAARLRSLGADQILQAPAD